MRSLFAVMILVAAAPLAAHHSFAAEYDGSKPMTVTGKVTQVDWRNPHAYIYIDVKNDAGGVTQMAIEGHPPNTLRRTGWVKGTINVNDQITVMGWAARDSSDRLAGREVTLANGKKLYWGPPSK